MTRTAFIIQLLSQLLLLYTTAIANIALAAASAEDKEDKETTTTTQQQLSWFQRREASEVMKNMDRMRIAEAKLLDFAFRFDTGTNNSSSSRRDDYDIVPFDTRIPRSVLPLVENDDKYITIHAVKVVSKKKDEETKQSTTTQTTTCREEEEEGEEEGEDGTTTTQTCREEEEGSGSGGVPLVLLHGHAIGGAYFYRNFVGLMNSGLFSVVYSVDMLGWGLSSRPDFHSFRNDDYSVSNVEDFFVEALEAWRQQQPDLMQQKMLLLGHSIGGYVTVAYCERYGRHVSDLLLASPAGVTEETPETRRRRKQNQRNIVYGSISGLYEKLFFSPSIASGDAVNLLPGAVGYYSSKRYIQKRISSITDGEEQSVLGEYLYRNSILPGCAEHAMKYIVNPYTFAKFPTKHRIPRLQHVKTVTIFYGVDDWMDARGGLQTQLICEKQRRQQQQQQEELKEIGGGGPPPKVEVYHLKNAGHILMIDNWEAFNNIIIKVAARNQQQEQEQQNQEQDEPEKTIDETNDTTTTTAVADDDITVPVKLYPVVAKKKYQQQETPKSSSTQNNDKDENEEDDDDDVLLETELSTEQQVVQNLLECRWPYSKR